MIEFYSKLKEEYVLAFINTDNLDKLNQIQEELNYLCSTPFFHLLVFSEKMDKVDGIDIIACKESITEEAIYTVGNDFFDKNIHISLELFDILWYNDFE